MRTCADWRDGIDMIGRVLAKRIPGAGAAIRWDRVLAGHTSHVGGGGKGEARHHERIAAGVTDFSWLAHTRLHRRVAQVARFDLAFRITTVTSLRWRAVV